MARQIGYTEEELAALSDESGRGIFEPALRAALKYSDLMTGDAHAVDDTFFVELKRHYTDPQIVELSCVVGLANYFNRFTTALRIDLSGTNAPYGQ